MTQPPPPPPPPQLLCPAGGELSLAVGEQVIVRDQSTYCFNFAPTGSVTEYLLGVQSVSEGDGQGGVVVRNITVRGQRVTTAALQAAAQAAPPAPSDPGGALQLSPELLRHPGLQLLREHREAHGAMFARMLQPVRDTFVRQDIRSAAQRGPARAIVTGAEEVGDQVEFRVRKGSASDCTQSASRTVLAELRVKNEKSMWFVDVENPAGGFTDAQLQELADLFDNHIHATETAHFGAVSDMDSNGRIGIVVTKQINVDNGDGPQVLGFVNPCDFFTREETGAQNDLHTSNEGEFFYAIAPDPDSTVGQAQDTDRLFDFLPVIIAHEFAHIIQFTYRFPQGVESFEFMALFMAEGMATLGEEIVGHSIIGNAPGQNLSIAVGLDFGDTQPYPWYANSWVDLVYYFGWPGGEVDDNTPRVEGAPQECTWTDAGEDDPCGSRPLWYGVTWSFLRWAADQFGEQLGGEPALHQTLINNNVAGFDNLREILGQFGPLEDLLAQWAAAFYMDDRPGQSDPRHVVSSWDYYSALHGAERVKTQAWLEPLRKSYSDFTEEIKVIDPSTAYFLVGGSVAPQYSLKVERSGSGALGSDIQVWVVRTK